MDTESLNRRMDALQARMDQLEARSVPIDFNAVTGESPTQVVRIDSRIEQIWRDPNVRRIVQAIIVALGLTWGVWISIRGY